MRINEVIEENPRGILSRAGDRIKSTFGSNTAKGRLQLDKVLKKAVDDVEVKLGQAGVDFNTGANIDSVIPVVQRHFMDLKFDNQILNTALKDLNDAVGSYNKMKADNTDPSGKALITAELKKVKDALPGAISQVLTQSQASNKMPADADGDGKADNQTPQMPGGVSDTSQAFKGNAQKVGGAAASSLIQALSKLDPDMQAYAFLWLGGNTVTDVKTQK